jgi:hypothetical protein
MDVHFAHVDEPFDQPAQPKLVGVPCDTAFADNLIHRPAPFVGL